MHGGVGGVEPQGFPLSRLASAYPANALVMTSDMRRENAAGSVSGSRSAIHA